MSENESDNPIMDYLDRQVFTYYESRKTDLLKLSTDDTLDLNEYRDLIKRIATFAMVETATYWNREENKRNWQEDASHENGNYMNTCCVCKEIFYGHKRRVVCKVCTTNGWEGK